MLTKPTIKTLSVDGVSINIRRWTVKSKLAFAQDTEDRASFLAKLLIYSICDEAGTLLYTEADIPMMLELDAVFAEQIAKEVLSLNQLDLEKKDS